MVPALGCSPLFPNLPATLLSVELLRHQHTQSKRETTAESYALSSSSHSLLLKFSNSSFNHWKTYLNDAPGAEDTQPCLAPSEILQSRP